MVWTNNNASHQLLLTKAVDALLGVHKLNRDVALSLINEDLPVRGQVDNHSCCHHGVREVGLENNQPRHQSRFEISTIITRYQKVSV